MKDNSGLIQLDVLYRPSEVARPSKRNPAGKSLLDMDYITLWRKIDRGEIVVQEDAPTRVGRRVFIRGIELVNYIKRGSKGIINK